MDVINSSINVLQEIIDILRKYRKNKYDVVICIPKEHRKEFFRLYSNMLWSKDTKFFMDNLVDLWEFLEKIIPEVSDASEWKYFIDDQHPMIGKLRK